MSIDFNAVLLAPLYATLGIEATITLPGGEFFDVTIIDKTAGVEVGGGVEVGTIYPSAAVQYESLTNAGVNPGDCVSGSISFHGFTWKIFAYKIDPNPSGEKSSEVLLLLSEPHELTSSS